MGSSISVDLVPRYHEKDLVLLIDNDWVTAMDFIHLTYHYIMLISERFKHSKGSATIKQKF